MCHNLKEDAENGCHIVPVREDVSDLLEKYKWLEQNPETYKRIQTNLNTFARNSLTPAHAYLYVFEHIMGGKSSRRGKDLNMSDFEESLHHQFTRYSASSWGKPANESKCIWKSDMLVNKGVVLAPPAHIPNPKYRSTCCLDLKNLTAASSSSSNRDSNNSNSSNNLVTCVLDPSDQNPKNAQTQLSPCL
jgi:hypothetical protein